jgi:tetratricopeptide (TPR) repeat protein
MSRLTLHRTLYWVGFIVVVLFIGSLGLVGAGATVDKDIMRLEKRVTTAAGKEKVDMLNRLAALTFRHAPQKCLEYGQEALNLSRTLNYPEGEANALIYMGLGYSYGEGDKKKALALYQQGLKRFEEQGDQKKIANTLIKIGIVHKDVSRYDEAMANYRKALKIYENLDYKEGIAVAFNNLGIVYDDLGHYAKALDYFLKSLKIREELGDTGQLAAVFTNIGTIYWRIKDYDRALEYFNKTLAIDQATGNKSDISGSLHNIAMVHHSLGHHGKALEYYQKSLHLKEEIGAKRGTAYTLINIGTVYYSTDRCRQALTYFFKALKPMEELEDQNGLAGTLGNIGAAYIKLQRYDDALPYLERCIKTARAIRTPGLLSEHYQNLSRLYEAKGNPIKALEYFKLFHEEDKKIFNESSSQQIARLRTQYETEKKENKIKALEQERSIQGLENRVKTIIGGLLLLGLAIISVVVYKAYTHYRKEAAQKEEKLKRLQRESRLKLFLAGIDKHFLFNSLDSIMGLEKIPAPIKDNLKKLSALYRYILSSSEKPVIPLREELAAVKDYLTIEKKILKNHLDFNISVAEEELLDCRVMPQTILTLVENAVKHGITPKEEGGAIHIDIYSENKSLIIKVSDTGLGIEPGVMNQAGFGLFSVQERLKLYYKNRARFTLKPLVEGGTLAVMEVPYG